MDALYLTERMRKQWLKMLYKYWEERDITYSYDFDFWPEWLFQYFNELTLYEAIESAYILGKQE